MSHSYASNHLHIVFSTRNRQDLISEPNQALLWAYVAGIGKNIGIQALKIGGIANHMHALVGLPATLSLSAAIQKIKTNSSKWMHENGVKEFEWQQGYGAIVEIQAVSGASIVEFTLHTWELDSPATKRNTFKGKIVAPEE